MPRRCLVRALALCLLVLLPRAAAAADHAGRKGEVLLNARAGPGSECKPVGAITTGDPVEILQQGDGWTLVRSEKTGEGWIPAGFLQDAPPPVVRLERAEGEAVALRQRVEELS